MASGGFPTTYKYRPLESDRHIRLLQILTNSDDDKSQMELPNEDAQLEFEAISYTWGKPDRDLIGLTENLSQALPHLCHHSSTKLLWIDQLCINQIDLAEKSKQILLMSQIYKSARRVLIWLGPADENSRLCKQFLDAAAKMIQGMPNSDRMTPGMRSTFISPGTDPIYAPAIRNFWSRPWFSRGWVVQELLRAQTPSFLAGDVEMNMQDLADLQTIPPAHQPGEAEQTWYSYNILMNLKLHAFTDEQPLRFLRVMYQVSQEFLTLELADQLYAFLGMLEGSSFTPDYSVSTKANFTRFAASLADDFGSLDFLSLWSANLDELLPNTPQELKGFPSWVPSWSATPLSAPFRFATGGVRSLRGEITWNAADGRQHVHLETQNGDAATTGRLVVKGKIIGFIETLSSARFHLYEDPPNEYLDGLVTQLKQDLPGLEEWTTKDMIAFLNVVASNVLGLKPKPLFNEVANLSRYNEALATCLSTGRGRRFIRMRDGRLGLGPYIGTKARGEEKNGSPVVVIHGCSVPIVLDVVSEERNEYTVVGDAYVEGIMHGEAVLWAEEDANTFVLV
ncbi:heterokaryon incompatibility protein [Lindgomyces ingoldianus]|uniref:Heterokaryon incompatibility protein n=1 Tax=Lindgomyces ingoldianus TaxID=673940 RepID=A0ACB6R9S0_9PLEO|nr:heterokaryon incompatibility protein [Lindgomyces ingoldianus]KAF2475901.1 heterokaryon incompatibility protein [Lindgomyces ingoldianus]